MRFLILMLFPSLCFADWTPADTGFQVAYTVLLAADCAQTRYGASHPTKFQETNPMLGDYPSKGKINNACLIAGLGHFGISYILAPGARRLWQAGAIMIEVYTVANNKHVGVKMEF